LRKKNTLQTEDEYAGISGAVADKVLALGAVADFGAQNFHLTTRVDAR
jgi:hypothetical protein